MAKDYMAQLLDDLMGRGRNAAPNEQNEFTWEDESVSGEEFWLGPRKVFRFSRRILLFILLRPFSL